ncbi:substrate-binding domain-containing protein [Candidatus Halocynthiibacter alkanivorans]|jgi:LacI family transcriptional regulator, galactose operon repressor|uniref:substrate-binding domain-containing protein n=1 Tax=Candidatus Halocynthiibacter alkanivorans TaxID=2267619 RepID=UPI000DF1376B|nr:substrate-binding domain-containing protein [Candidatus Halocynthiibacter alkanivorans]
MNLKDLSDYLGLSQTTVSRALNGYPEVSEKTRKRVQDAAAAHNYRPNTRAKGLATGRTMSIGHVIPISARHEIVNPIFADFIAGAGEIYSKNGYDMHLTVVPDTDEARVYRDIASKGSVDGVIVHGPLQNDPRIKLLQDLGLPFAVHGRSGRGDEDYNWVDVNNARAFERATNFLIDLGHRRIALLNGNEKMDFAARRRLGYLTAHGARGLTHDPALMFSDEMTEHYGYASVLRALDHPSPPTAFLISSIISSIGARRALEERGLQLGRDISIITHDDELSYLKNGEDLPIFTATRSSVREAGRICAQMVLDVIANPTSPPQHRLLESDLTVGNSTGPAP